MRFHGMDLARAVLMILGVFYHAGLIYSIGDGWRVQAEAASIWFNYLADFSHFFRMPAFYIVGGFFLALSLSKYDIQRVLIDRTFRLLVPMFVVGFSFNSIMNYYSNNIIVDESLFLYVIKGQWLGHLWFIGNLFVYCIGYSLVRKQIELVDVHKVGVYKFYYITIAILSVVFLILSLIASIIPIHKIFFISVKDIVIYFPYFILGALLFNNVTLLDRLSSSGFKVQVLFNVLLGTSLFILHDFELSNGISLVLGSIFTAASSILVISIFHRVKSNSAFTLKISSSSYTIYLMHQPIMVVIFGFTDGFFGSILLDYLLICILTLVFSYIVHVLFVMKSQVLKFLLNGVPYFKVKIGTFSNSRRP